MVRQVSQGFKKEDIIPSVQFFHNNIHKFDKRDINQYSTAKELENKIKDIYEQLQKQKKPRRQIKQEGSEKLYEDEEYVFVRIDTKEACQIYGAHTKWCITMEGQTYYEQYKGSNIIFYFLLRKNPQDDNFDKIAFAVFRDFDNNIKEIQIYDARDNLISENKIDESIRGEIFSIINQDAPKRPKDVLAKIKEGSATMEEAKNYFASFKFDDFIQLNKDLIF